MALPGLNKAVLERITKELGLQTLTDKLPLDLIPTIQPVLISNPNPHITIVKHTTGAGTLFTTPTDRDFFLTTAFLSANSLNADGGLNTLTVTPEDGKSVVLLSTFSTSLLGVVAPNNIIMPFPRPLKLKRGTTIVTVINSTSATFGITGYTVDQL